MTQDRDKVITGEGIIRGQVAEVIGDQTAGIIVDQEAEITEEHIAETIEGLEAETIGGQRVESPGDLAADTIKDMTKETAADLRAVITGEMVVIDTEVTARAENIEIRDQTPDMVIGKIERKMINMQEAIPETNTGKDLEREGIKIQ